MERGEETHPVFSHKRSFGQKAADDIASFAGSWTFIITFLVFLLGWMVVNIVAAVNHWDPYPFILLNLLLSTLAALQAPVILMSQNRQAQRDHLMAEYDFRINKLAEREIRELKEEVSFLKGEITYFRSLLDKKFSKR
jgi:uncharacterized membrane protein